MTHELVGRKFGRLTVERMAARRARCRCDCGSIKIVAQSALLNGKAVSCGCITRERVSARMRNGGASTTARVTFEEAWEQARQATERIAQSLRIKWEDA